MVTWVENGVPQYFCQYEYVSPYEIGWFQYVPFHYEKEFVFELAALSQVFARLCKAGLYGWVLWNIIEIKKFFTKKIVFISIMWYIIEYKGNF